MAQYFGSGISHFDLDHSKLQSLPMIADITGINIHGNGPDREQTKLMAGGEARESSL